MKKLFLLFLFCVSFGMSLFSAEQSVILENRNSNMSDVANGAPIQNVLFFPYVIYPAIGTFASEKETGSKTPIAQNSVTIVDVVSYQDLVADNEYTISGYLKDKSTYQKLVVAGHNVTSEKTFTPVTSSGTIELEFTFDASTLFGKSIVVFEYLYKDNIVIASHADINDYAQTITFEAKPAAIIESPVGDSICMGGSYIFRVKATGDDLSYQWYLEGDSIFDAHADTLLVEKAEYPGGYYNVEVKGYNGAIASEPVLLWVADSLPDRLTFADLPDDPAIVGQSYTVRLSEWSDVTNYAWSYEGTGDVSFDPSSGEANETEITFHTPGAGMLSVAMQHICGERTAIVAIRGEKSTAIDVIEKEAISIYPNLVKNVLKIMLPKGPNTKVEIFDTNGSQVYSTFASGYLEVSVEGWSNGAYIVVANGESVKVIKD